MSKILETKEKIQSALGENYAHYADLAKRVFSFKSRKAISVEEFLLKARKFFTPDTIHLHNEFCLWMIVESDTLSPVSGGSSFSYICSELQEETVQYRKKRKLFSSDGKYEMVSPKRTFHRPLLENYISLTSPITEKMVQSNPELCDVSIVHGRVLLIALENGLVLADEKVVKLLLHAVRSQLKTILMATLSRRSAYKLHENKFQHSVGYLPINVFQSNTQKSLQHAEHSSSGSMYGLQHAVKRPFRLCSDIDSAYDMVMLKQRPPVSVWDLFDALQVHRDAIPNHSVYGPNMEKIICRLYHPTQEEIKIKELQSEQKAHKECITFQQKMNDKLEDLKKEQVEMKRFLDQMSNR